MKTGEKILGRFKQCDLYDTSRSDAAKAILRDRGIAVVTGSSYGHSCIFFVQNGVFVGIRDGQHEVYFLTAGPLTEWRAGCQDPRALDSCLPKPKRGELRRVDLAPEEIKGKLLTIASEISSDIEEAIQAAWKEMRDAEEKRLRKIEAREQAIISVWTKHDEA